MTMAGSFINTQIKESISDLMNSKYLWMGFEKSVHFESYTSGGSDIASM